MNEVKFDKVKIIFTDLDKTLLNDEKEISDFSKGVLLNLKAKRILLVLSTVRIFQTSQRFYKELECSGIIYCNGAVVKYGDHIIQETKMDDELVQAMISTVLDKKFHIRFSVMTKNEMYTNYYDKNTVFIKNNKELKFKDCIRVIFYGLSLELEQQLFQAWGGFFRICRLEGKNVMVCSKEATKMNGVYALLNYLDIYKEQAAIFGDDWNDLECMEQAGYGIVVANADEEIKKRVRYHCESNNEDGVAKWIKQYLL